MGYYLAGFDVIGVDINPQPRYPFKFIQGDVFEVWDSLPHDKAAAYGASPPCQINSIMTKGRWQDRLNDHADLIAPTRKLLQETGKPYVIENVPGANLFTPLLLCGTMFNLKTEYGNPLYRHRLFENNIGLFFPPVSCQHRNDKYAIGVYGGGQHPARQSHYRSAERNVTGKYGIDQRKQAMDIDWMNGKGLNQAIPPAYTEWIGKRLMEYIR